MQLEGRRRQSDEIEIDAPQQDGFRRLRPRRQTVTLMLRRDEGIEGIDAPFRAPHDGDRGAFHGLERFPGVVLAPVSAKLHQSLTSDCQLLGARFVPRIAGSMAAEQLQEIGGGVAITVLVGDGLQTGENIAVLAGLAKLFAQRGQACAEDVSWFVVLVCLGGIG